MCPFGCEPAPCELCERTESVVRGEWLSDAGAIVLGLVIGAAFAALITAALL